RALGARACRRGAGGRGGLSSGEVASAPMGAPYWFEEMHPRPRLDPAGHVEVAIVGGGVTGCSCALTLALAGRSVRVYEAREIGSGASGRNGGFGLWGGAMAYGRAGRPLGHGRAQGYWTLA